MRYSLIATAGLLAAAAPAAAQIPLSAPDYAPGEPQVVISITDTKTMWEGLGYSPVMKNVRNLMNLPQVAQDPGYQEFLLELDKAEIDLGYSLKPDLLLTETLEGIDIYLSTPEGAQEPEILVVTDFQEAGRATALTDYLATRIKTEAAENAAAGLPAAEVAPLEIGGKAFTAVTQENLFFGNVEDLFFASSSEEGLRRALDPEAEEALEDSAKLESVWSNINEFNGQMHIYMDGEALAEAAELIDDPQLRQLRDAARPGTLGMSLGFTPQSITGAYFNQRESTPAEKELFSIPASSMNEVMTAAAPNPVVAFGANYIDGEVISRILSSSEYAEGTVGAQRIAEVESTLEQGLGLSLRNDILPAFGPDMVFAINRLGMPSAMMPEADMIMAIEVKDVEKARAVIDQIDAQLQVAMTQQARQMNPNAPEATPEITMVGEAEVRSWPLQNPMMPVQLAVSHAMTGDHWVVGITTDGVRTAVSRLQEGTGGLNDSARWVDASQSLPEEFNAFVLVDMGAIGGTVQQVAPLALSFAGGATPDAMTAVTLVTDMLRSLGTLYTVSNNAENGVGGHFRLAMP